MTGFKNEHWFFKEEVKTTPDKTFGDCFVHDFDTYMIFK
jgi:hypothetical protein